MATPLLGVEAVHLEYPTKVVFDSVSIGIEEGDRIGIVGRNGDGKSSLLGILAGTVEYQSGRVTTRNGLRFGVLGQRDSFDDSLSVKKAIVGDREDHEWAGDASIRDIIRGLVADVPWDVTVGELSGGQRRRVALASLLIGEWDLIALDEPTNHLDVEGISWLAAHLKKRWPSQQGGLVVITHDRWFLDEVCTETWEVHDGIVEPFEGGYAAYILQRVERDRQAAQAEKKRQNLMRKELAWLRRGAPARTSKPKFRIDAANKLIADVPPVRNSLELQRMAVSRLGKEVVNLEDAGVSYGDTEVLRDVTWRIAPGERTGILGANGAGKSTLLKLIAGEISPTTGRVKHGKTVKMGLLDQQFSQLADIGEDLVRTVLARYRTSFTIEGKELSPAQLLERLGFERAHLSARVEDLSGGQKRRLQLLLLLMEEPNVIALDEPTNDVDSDMLAAMEDLLDSWPGTLLVISHDRYLIERVTDQQYAILGNTLRHVPGGVDEYLRLREEEMRRATSSDIQSHEPANSTRLSGSDRWAVRKDVAAVERRMQKIESKMNAVERDMAGHDPSDYEGLQELNSTLQELSARYSELEDEWLELEAQLED